MIYRLLLIAALLAGGNAYAQVLSGTKTICASGCDYASINAAVTALNNSAVTGNLTFAIKPGIYNEQVTLKSYASSSLAYRVTFTSFTGNASDVVLNCPGGSAADNAHIFKLDNADRYVFSNLTFVGMGTHARPIYMTNGSDENEVKNSVFHMDSSGTGYSKYGVFTTAFGLEGTVNAASYLTISGNTFNGGSTSIFISMWGVVGTNPRDSFIYIRNNIIKGPFLQGIYSSYANVTEISGNKIFKSAASPGGTNAGGIHVYDVNKGLEAFNNYVHNPSFGPVYWNFGYKFMSAKGGTRSRVYNNVYVGQGTGIILDGNTNFDVYYNSVLMTGMGEATIALDVRNSTNSNLVNNVFANTIGGYALTVATASHIINSNNNVLYTSGSKIAKWGTADQSSLTALQTASGGFSNSLSYLPVFEGALSLKTVDLNINNKGVPITGITKDFEGNNRHATTPDLGAYEFSVRANDIRIISLLPTIPVRGENKIRFVAQNLGSNSLNGKNIDFEYSVDGGATWQGLETMPPTGLGNFGNTQLFEFAKTYNAVPTDMPQFCVRVANPASFSDEESSNNQICNPAACVGLRGTYTVGSGGDYSQILQVMNVLYNCGAGGPVTLNILPGIYPERLLLKPFKRENEQATLTIQSSTGNPGDVLITSAGGGFQKDHHTIRLDGIKGLIIKDISIENTNGFIGSGVHITRAADSNIIENCVINVTPGSSGSRTYGVVINAPDTFDRRDNTTRFGSYNTIKNCKIFGANTGVYAFSGYNSQFNSYDRDNIIEGNVVNGAIDFGIRCNQDYHDKVRYNKVTMSTTVNNNVGIMMERINKSFECVGNTVLGAGLYGIHLDMCDTRDSIGLAANNMVYLESRLTNQGAAMMTNYGYDNRIMHNTLVYKSGEMTNDSWGTAALLIPWHSNSNYVFNNIIHLLGSKGVAYSINNSSSIKKSDGNNFWAQNGKLCYWQGDTNIKHVDSFARRKNSDSNSVQLEPKYKSLTDLHLTNAALYQKGKAQSLVMKDIDMELRDLNRPTIGADELSAVDLALINPQPVTAVIGDNTVRVRLKNLGIRSLKDSIITLCYSTDGGATWDATRNYTHKIMGLTNLGDEESISFTKPWKIDSSGNYQLCVRMNPGSLLMDANPANNRVCGSVCVSTFTGGTYTVGGTDPDFTGLPELQAFLDAIKAAGCGISGPLEFIFRSGTYPGKLDVGHLPGMSATNSLTFRSATGVPEDVVLQAQGGQKTLWVIKGAQYVTLKGLTLENTADSALSVLEMGSNARFITIENCVLRARHASPYDQQSVLQLANRDLVLPNSKNVKITKCRIYGGYYGVRGDGNGPDGMDEDLLIERSEIRGAYALGVYLRNYKNMTLFKNQIVMAGANQNSMGIRLEKITGASVVESNTLLRAQNMGLYLDQVTGEPRIHIRNNMIGGGFNHDATVYAVFFNNASKVDFDFNSVLQDKRTFLSYGIYIEKGSDLRFRNNNLANMDNDAAYVLHMSDTNAITASNHNNFYTKGQALFFRNGDKNLAQWQSNTGFDANSVSVDPLFVNDTNLHTFNPALDQKGMPIAGVSKDIDEQPRDGTKPDIGADEFTPGLDAGIKAFVRPGSTENPTPGVAQPIEVKVRNFGDQTITGFGVSYSVNGQSPVNETYSASLDPAQEANYTFSGSWTPPGVGTYVLKSWTSLPADINAVNDTLTLNVQVLNVGMETDQEYTVRVWPQPARATIYVGVEHVQVEAFRVLDVQGRITAIQSTPVTGSEFSIDVRTWHPGWYLLHLDTERGPVHQRILIQ